MSRDHMLADVITVSCSLVIVLEKLTAKGNTIPGPERRSYFKASLLLLGVLVVITVPTPIYRYSTPQPKADIETVCH